MKTVLLTGGAGYIGSHVAVELLKNKNYDIIIVDNLSNSNIDKINNIKKVSNREVKFYQYDMMDRTLLNKVFDENKIDAVIHLAGLKSVGESCNQPYLYYNTNINITLNLLECMKLHNIYNLIFSSSATVYGSQNVPFTETMQTGVGITNPYGRTKYMIEEILKDYTKSSDKWKFVILRYFNPIGSHESGLLEENPNGIPNNLFPFILKVYNGKLEQLSIFGDDYDTPDKTALRDYIHVEDLARGHIAAFDLIISNKMDRLEIINLGTGTPYSVLEVVSAFEKVNNTTINKKIVGRREGDIVTSYATVDRAKEILNWKTELTLDAMVKVN
jgi:UDP-glucose 4-epimerase